jgi:hypothetical protein
MECEILSFTVQSLETRPMKFKWSELKIITLAVFNRFKKGNVPYRTEENVVYTRYRTRIIPRTPPSGQPGVTFQNSKTRWNADAREFCLHTEYTSNAALEQRMRLIGEMSQNIRFDRSLMFESNGSTVFEKTAPMNTPIEAVSIIVNRGAKDKSRLNLVVRPEYCGQPLLTALLALTAALQHTNSSSSGAIYQWKVMSPQLGIEGPESAVIYLSEDLEDGKVLHLLQQLLGNLHGYLMPLQACPWGHVELAPGIYGFELPDVNREMEVFRRSFGSSAGRLMSAIICTAAKNAVDWLYHDEGSAERRRAMIKKPADEWEFVRSKLDEVLDQLGWTLVD